MPKNRTFIICLLLILCCTQTLFATTVLEQHQYRRTYGSEISTMHWQRLAGDPELIITKIKNQVDQTEMDDQLATSSWQVKDELKQTDLRIERHNDRLHLQGLFKGEQVDRWQDIDEAHWFQTMSISFRTFLNSANTEITFWIVRPDTLGVHKLRAFKRGIEELTIQGKKVQAQKIELRLTGLAAPFWKANYWFRDGDHLFLRYLGPGGLPGTPKIAVELSSPLEQADLTAMTSKEEL